jgi:hypothetical protein
MVGFLRTTWEWIQGPRLGSDLLEFGRPAQVRSLQLLLPNLSPDQRQQLASYNYFDVIGGDTGTRYRIRNRYILNVERLDRRGRCTCRLCFGPQGELPNGDVMLAQKLALELFESEAIRIANASPPWAHTLELEYPMPPHRFDRHG